MEESLSMGFGLISLIIGMVCHYVAAVIRKAYAAKVRDRGWNEIMLGHELPKLKEDINNLGDM